MLFVSMQLIGAIDRFLDFVDGFFVSMCTVWRDPRKILG